jgi:hypothetical protein
MLIIFLLFTSQCREARAEISEKILDVDDYKISPFHFDYKICLKSSK